MDGWSHLIRRQVIEVEASGEHLATRMLDELSRLQSTVIEPILDELCSAEHDPRSVVRIDRLEVDLGVLPAVALEDAIAAGLRERLPPLLSAALDRSRAGTSPADDAVRGLARNQAGGRESSSRSRQLEMLTYFAKTGSLPWWVDTDVPRPIERGFKDLMVVAPSAVIGLLFWARVDARYLRRLLLASPEAVRPELIDAAVSARFPSLPADRVELVRMSAAGGAVDGSASVGPPTPIEVLEAAITSEVADPIELIAAMAAASSSRSAGPVSGTPDDDGNRQGRGPVWTAGLGEFLAGLSEAELADRSRLLAAVAGRRSQPPRAGPGASEREVSIAVDDESAPTGTVADPGPTRADSVVGESAPTETVPGPGPGPTRADSVVGEPPAGAVDSVVADPGTTPADSVVGEPAAGAADSVVGELAAGAAEALLAQSWPLGLAERVLATLLEVDGAPRSRTAETLEVPAAGTSFDPVQEVDFTDTDVTYVANAGVVLLAPFLPTFFERLELLSDRGDEFRGDGTRQQAIGLLHYLVVGRSVPAEYEVTLSKVLCGMDPGAVFEGWEGPTDHEIDACDSLIAAVIEHASALGEQSPDGFRAAFLVRNGSLAAEAGRWLLRVERQSYDLLLERLPWSIAWVKLPWMSAPLQVDW